MIKPQTWDGLSISWVSQAPHTHNEDVPMHRQNCAKHGRGSYWRSSTRRLGDEVICWIYFVSKAFFGTEMVSMSFSCRGYIKFATSVGMTGVTARYVFSLNFCEVASNVSCKIWSWILEMPWCPTCRSLDFTQGSNLKAQKFRKFPHVGKGMLVSTSAISFARDPGTKAIHHWPMIRCNWRRSGRI